MKKLLGIFTISVFILSILASVSSELKMKVMNLNEKSKYSATSVPVPKMYHSYNYANKIVISQDNIVSDLNNKKGENKTKNVQLVE